MKLSQRCIELTKRFEGCKLQAYHDSVGRLTIGYGWTHAVGDMPLCEGMCIDQQTADSLLLRGLNDCAEHVSEMVTVPLSQGQFDALVDFAYNLGENALRNSTLLKKLNSGNYQGADDEFGKWIYADGEVLQGLVNRRNAEKELFLS